MILSEERWLPVPGYEGRYSVSSEGRVRNDRRGRLLKPFLSGPKRRQYPRVRLYFDNVTRDLFVHVLVMLAFEGPPSDGYEIDHVDNDPCNPKYANLEYVTRSEQQRRVYRRDGRTPVDRVGEKNACARLTWDQVRDIRRAHKLGVRNKDLAATYQVDPSTISMIVTGRNWKEAA